MTVRPILQFGHPALRVCSAAIAPGDPDLPSHIADLADTLADFRRRTTWGRGIAANQVGITKRLIVLNLGDGPQALVNPEITWQSDETYELWDDCFSLPDVLVRVRRPVSMSIRYVDAQFAPRTMERLDPAVTELLHHELDHIDGVLMVDRVIDPRLIIARAMRDQAVTALPAATART